jgi:hypothetical protein
VAVRYAVGVAFGGFLVADGGEEKARGDVGERAEGVVGLEMKTSKPWWK